MKPRHEFVEVSDGGLCDDFGGGGGGAIDGFGVGVFDGWSSMCFDKWWGIVTKGVERTVVFEVVFGEFEYIAEINVFARCEWESVCLHGWWL